MMISTRRFYLSLVLGLCASSVAIGASRATDNTLKSGIDRSNFDTSVKPGNDFFEYVNGEWNKRNPIPPEYSRWAHFPSCITTT